MQDEVCDLTIIGAGPTGLFAAFCGGMRGMRTKVIERLPEAGGQLAVLYPDKYIYDAPGHAKIRAGDLVKELYLQSFTFAEPAYYFDEHVQRLHRRGDDLLLVQTDKREHLTRTVLIAAGIGAFMPKRLNVPGTEEGRPGIHYFVRDLPQFEGREVLVVGGGDTAFDWCLALKDIARKVTLIHRSDRFRAHEASIREVMDSSVEVKTFHEMKRVLGDGNVRGAILYDNRTGQEKDIYLDDLVVAVGFDADLGELRMCGVTMDEHLRQIVVNPRMETNLRGVYAAGDVTELTYLEKTELPESQQVFEGSSLSFPSIKFEERKEKWGLIVMGYAQAAIAVNYAKHEIDPKSRLTPSHSSDPGFRPR